MVGFLWSSGFFSVQKHADQGLDTNGVLSLNVALQLTDKLSGVFPDLTGQPLRLAHLPAALKKEEMVKDK